MTLAPRRPSGRVVILSNPTSSIGTSLVADLAREGARILLPGRSLDELHVLATSIHEAGGKPTIVCCDLASEADRAQLVSYTMRLYHRLDVLVTELGAGIDSVTTAQGAWRMIDAEFSAMLDLVLLALPQMQRGSIVNISSIGPPEASEAGCAYWAGQFLVRAFSGAVRRHLRDGSIEIAAVYRSLARAGYAPRARSWQTFVTLDSYDFDTGDDVSGPAAQWIYVHRGLPAETRHETRSSATDSRIARGALARGGGKGRTGY